MAGHVVRISRIQISFNARLVLGIASLFLLFIIENACQGIQRGQVLTVDDLLNHSAMYTSKMVDVRGEIMMDYHGPTLCNAKERGFFVVLPEAVFPKPDFRLEADHRYDEYKRLYIEIASIQRTLGKAKLFATLRGRYDMYTVTLLANGKELFDYNPPIGTLARHRFVLQKVLNLEIQKIGAK